MINDVGAFSGVEAQACDFKTGCKFDSHWKGGNILYFNFFAQHAMSLEFVYVFKHKRELLSRESFNVELRQETFIEARYFYPQRDRDRDKRDALLLL